MSQSTLASHTALGEKFIHLLSLGTSTDIPAFVSLFSDSLQWHDHAFFVTQHTSATLPTFLTLFLTAITDFSITTKAVLPTEKGVVVQMVYHGRMVGDLPGRKASGKSFSTNVCVILGVGEDGKVDVVDEYYTSNIDEGVGDVEAYRAMGKE